MLNIDQIKKYYHKGTINEMCLFDHFDLKVKEGQFVCIIGSNGSGKSSLLNLICGSIELDDGDISINEKSIKKEKEYERMKKIGRVYQDPAAGTCPNMTILENLSMADNKGKKFGLKKGIQKNRIDDYKNVLKKLNLGLEDKLDVKVSTMSGGQRQALALIMATLTPIEFLILDEHTAALDPKTSELIMKMTNQIVREKNLTTMMVTHNLRFALEYGDRLIMMHEGKIIMDVEDEEKKNLDMKEILDKFNQISIEYGN